MLAAYLLVAQALFAGLATGASAAPRDAFGQVLCTTTDADGRDAPSQSPHLADCCALGCAMFGPGVAPPPDAAALSGAQDPAHVSAELPRESAASWVSERRPQNSRAPPRNG